MGTQGGKALIPPEKRISKNRFRFAHSGFYVLEPVWNSVTLSGEVKGHHPEGADSNLKDEGPPSIHPEGAGAAWPVALAPCSADREQKLPWNQSNS